MNLGANVFYIGSVLLILVAVIAIFLIVFGYFKKKLIVPKKVMVVIPLAIGALLAVLAMISYQGFPWLTVIGTIAVSAIASIILFLWLSYILEPIAKKMGYSDPKDNIEDNTT